MKSLFPIFLILYWQIASALGLSLRYVTIPNYAVTDGTVDLSCEFNLLPSDKLLFLKWYKDEQEFFRVTPSSPQPILTFPLDGVFVELSRSNFNQLMLRNLTLRTSGVYKCEAMAEGTFQAPFGSGPMVVIAPPESLPEITGVHSLVNVGDRINGNCTSYRSKPVATLTFYVNDFALENSEITEYLPIPQANELENSILGFNFLSEVGHFKRGYLELRCTATVYNFYWSLTMNVSEVNINAQPSHTGLPSSGSVLGFKTTQMQVLGVFLSLVMAKCMVDFQEVKVLA